MPKSKTRLGLLGTGFMAQLAHLPEFAAVPNCEIAAIASHRPHLAQTLAARHGIPQVYDDYESLLADPSLDAVLCIQPFHNHYHLGRQILEAGKSLFTEKPMVMRLDEGQALVELAESQGLTYGVGYMKRYDPGVLLARERIHALAASGELGRLRLVDAHCYLGDWLQNAGAPQTSAETTAYPELERRYPDHVPPALASAYDYLLEVYTHNLNLIRFLLPEDSLECLSAARRGDETWAVTLAAGETLVTLRGAPTASREWDEGTDFIFERGKVSVRTPAPMNRQAVAEVVQSVGQGETFADSRLQAKIEWSFARQARGFVEALQGGAPFLSPGRDCLRDLELVEQIFRVV